MYIYMYKEKERIEKEHLREREERQVQFSKNFWNSLDLQTQISPKKTLRKIFTMIQTRINKE